MIAMIAMIAACSDTDTDTDTTEDTAPELGDTGDTGETAPPAPPELAEVLTGQVRGAFLFYSAELDSYPGQDGWIYAPTAWTFGTDGSLVAYVWNEDPSAGGYQLDSYSGTYRVDGAVLSLAIVTSSGAPDFGMAITPTVEASGDVSWPWTLRDGTEGVITLNQAWDTGYPTGADE